MSMPTFYICFRNIQRFLLTKLHEESNYHLDKTGQDDNSSMVTQIISFLIQSRTRSLVLVTATVGEKAVVNWATTMNQVLIESRDF